MFTACSLLVLIPTNLLLVPCVRDIELKVKHEFSFVVLFTEIRLKRYMGKSIGQQRTGGKE